MELLSGKELASVIKDEVKEEVAELSGIGKRVRLAVVQVGNNKASSVYVRNKQEACKYTGIQSTTYKINEETHEDALITLIHELNNDSTVDGILVQLPLPSHMDESKIIQAIAPHKDVDGFNAYNVGNHAIGNETFVPCTAAGIMELLTRNGIQIEGKNCVVVGRSNIVGKPTAMELLHRNGTVTVCHSKTKDLKEICKAADILVCAIGKAKFFNEEYISTNTTVIDVGIHRRENGTLCGDVDFERVRDIKGITITPVPGGVGAMTVAMLMKNCVKAAKRRCIDVV